jgi:hypothetical protein
MSMVTNIIFVFSYQSNPEEKIKEVNKYFVGRLGCRYVKGLQYIDCCSESIGGDKCLEAKIAIGAFNGFMIDEFIEHIGKIEWDDPQALQILIKEQHDYEFKSIAPFGN